MTKKLWFNRKNGVFIEDTCGLNECEHCPYEVEPPKEYCDCDARKVRCAIETFLEQRDDRGYPIYELTQKPKASGYTHAVYHWDAGLDEDVLLTEPAGKLFPTIKSFDPEEEEMPEFEGHKYRILTYAAQLNRIDLDCEPLTDYPKTLVVGCRCELSEQGREILINLREWDYPDGNVDEFEGGETKEQFERRLRSYVPPFT